VRTKGEEYYGSVWQSVAKAVLTVLNFATFFTDNEDNPEVAVDACAATTSEVQSLLYSPKTLCIMVRVTKDLVDLAL
jgi:hypothetical protein